MENDDKTVKQQLIKTIESIRNKYKSLQQQSQQLDDVLNIQYKPILSALDKVHINKHDSSNNENNDILEHGNSGIALRKDSSANENEWNPHVLINKLATVNDFLPVLNTSKHDKRYGINLRSGRYFIGSAELQFKNNRLHIGNESLPLTCGLLNLLFLKNPKKFTKADINTYKYIIKQSKLHIPSTVRANSSLKLKKVILPMFQEKQGKSLQTDYMEVMRNGKIDYKYWDDPNELVERLRLLISSQAAGHSGHNNEIIELIGELREARIIK